MRQIKRLYRRYQSFVFSTALFGVSALLLIVGIIPVFEKTKEIWADTRELQAKIKVLAVHVGQLDALNEQVLSKQFFDLISSLPADKSLQSIFLTSDVLFGQSGISVSSISIQSPGLLASGSATAQDREEKNLGVSKINFTILGKGTYEQVQTLLKNVHSVRRLVNLKRLDLGFSKTDSSVSVKFDLEAFYKPLSSQVPTVDTAVPIVTSADEALLVKLSKYPWLSQPVANISAHINSQGRSDPFSP